MLNEYLKTMPNKPYCVKGRKSAIWVFFDAFPEHEVNHTEDGPCIYMQDVESYIQDSDMDKVLIKY